ncbi:hypothetical protein SBY92_004616 [Candida maltosa Xu316]
MIALALSARGAKAWTSLAEAPYIIAAAGTDFTTTWTTTDSKGKTVTKSGIANADDYNTAITSTFGEAVYTSLANAPVVVGSGVDFTTTWTTTDAQGSTIVRSGVANKDDYNTAILTTYTPQPVAIAAAEDEAADEDTDIRFSLAGAAPVTVVAEGSAYTTTWTVTADDGSEVTHSGIAFADDYNTAITTTFAPHNDANGWTTVAGASVVAGSGTSHTITWTTTNAQGSAVTKSGVIIVDDYNTATIKTFDATTSAVESKAPAPVKSSSSSSSSEKIWTSLANEAITSEDEEVPTTSTTSTEDPVDPTEDPVVEDPADPTEPAAEDPADPTEDPEDPADPTEDPVDPTEDPTVEDPAAEETPEADPEASATATDETHEPEDNQSSVQPSDDVTENTYTTAYETTDASGQVVTTSEVIIVGTDEQGNLTTVTSSIESTTAEDNEASDVVVETVTETITSCDEEQKCTESVHIFTTTSSKAPVVAPTTTSPASQSVVVPTSASQSSVVDELVNSGNSLKSSMFVVYSLSALGLFALL